MTISTPTLEERINAIEDRLAIYTLIASHPPSADTGIADYVRSVYLEDGVLDRGSMLDGARGVDAIDSFTLKPEHEQAIQGGLAHFTGLPLIDLLGDEAIVTSYLQIIQLDRDATPRELPNHGASHGYRIHRVVVNRWHLVKRDRQWWIQNRMLLPVDGSSASRVLLSQGLMPILAKRTSASNLEAG